jgi:hypothetical protein
MHVWQMQNGGITSTRNAWYANIAGEVKSGDRGQAYEYDQALAKGTPFRNLNPEQQAALVEAAFQQSLFSGAKAPPGSVFAQYPNLFQEIASTLKKRSLRSRTVAERGRRPRTPARRSHLYSKRGASSKAAISPDACAQPPAAPAPRSGGSARRP